MTEGSRNTDATQAETAGLSRLIEVVERLHRDHTVSFIAAGDEKIYAYGGAGFVAIVSDLLFDRVVDIETPTKKFRIEPVASGGHAVVGSSENDPPTEQDLVDTADGFERYYARRIGRV